MTISRFLTTASAAVLACMMAVPSQAATYTYDIDHSFGLLRDNLLGAYAKPRSGRGGFTGSFTIDDTFATTHRILSFNFTSTNTATGFTAENSYSYSSADSTDTYTFSDLGYWAQSYQHSFSNPSAAVSCSEGLIAPSGQHQGRAYGVNGSNLRIHTPYSFTAGDSDLSIKAYETFGTAPLCASAGFADLGYEHTQYNTWALSGSLRVDTTTDGTGNGSGSGMSPVPVPASFPLLALGLGALGYFKRRIRS